MNKNPLISVIVPVYNVEKYLSKCIESILDQTYTNIELLLIDDGSQDSSGRICDEYAKKDSRIKVFHQKNSGVSSARNFGLSKSKGEWIYFLDADDWLDLNTFTVLFSKSHSNDIIRHFVKDVISLEPLVTHKRQYPIPRSKEEFFKQIVSRQTFLGVCGALYASYLFENVRFDDTISLGEDWMVLTQVVRKSKSVKVIPETYYFYNKINEGSCTSFFSEKKYNDNCSALYHVFSNNTASLKKEKLLASIDIQYHSFYMLLKDSTSLAYDSFTTITKVTGNKLSLIDILRSPAPFLKKIIVLLVRNKVVFNSLKKVYHLIKKGK